MGFDAWRQESSTLDGCGWCRERFRVGDVAVYVEDANGGEMLRLHDDCLGRARAAIPSKRAVAPVAAERAQRPTQVTSEDDA